MGDVNGKAVVDFAVGKLKTKVGSGECFDLADAALKAAGAKSADAYGTVVPEADYVWGNKVLIGSVLPGDVIQYRDYKMVRTVTVDVTLTFSDGAELDLPDETFKNTERPHHTAIVTAAPVGGAIKVIEQNVDRGNGNEKLVDYGQIYFSAPADDTNTVKSKALFDGNWAKKAKATAVNDAEYQKLVDSLVKKHFGKPIELTTVTTIKYEVTGTLTAYRPQTP